jgi:eukaryotic-like serine/threonine-protein kinase
MNALLPISEERSFTMLGMAHGWAGLLVSLLRWHEVAGTPIPASIEVRIDELIDLAMVSTTSLTWGWTNAMDHRAATSTMTGWCSGNAGHVALLRLAARATCEPRYLELAERAAAPLLSTSPRLGSLCCGAAGCIHALRSLGDAVSGTKWVRSADHLSRSSATAALSLFGDGARLAYRASEPDTALHSLFKGPVGLAAAIADQQSGVVHAPWIGIPN